MLKELKISNFRGFGNEIKVRFAPITVLIGRNNAGKSSIIKFLLMLQQSLETGSAGFLAARGSRVNLGRFADLRNVKSGEKYLRFSLEVEEKGSPRDAVWLQLAHKGQHALEEIRYMTEATVHYKARSDSFQGKDHKVMLYSGKKEILRRSMRITPNSSFLDFEDEQQKDLSEKKDDANITMSVNAEKACVEILRRKIAAIGHILPIREPVLPRVLDTGEPAPASEVGQRGQYAMHHLQKIDDLRENRGAFIRQHLEKVMGIANIKFSKTADGFMRCHAVNKKTMAKVNIADFGFGVSQCIPIVVQGAIMDPNTMLMVEQPEVQVHPSAQLEMGGFFADLWKKRQVASVIETHSANILLRLRRLVKRGDLDSSEVSIFYLDFQKGQSKIKNIAIRDDGSLSRGIPMRFFGEDIIEALEMGARE
ncbi:MAG: AAA family ATPase [Gammaproteobacteria bacterium]|nr:AAA family ATPase [Gammaproteobacteria bacterium]MDA7961078.1 AAA family ATPase [Gammaproteobacteria bacterium]MDA8023201.1 AAA family ATPase [Gammaproteobacteria bacterium]